MPPIINQFKRNGLQLVLNKKSLSIQRTKRDSLKLTTNLYTFLALDLVLVFGCSLTIAAFTKGSATAIQAAGPPAT
jgi:hypothetical protein